MIYFVQDSASCNIKIGFTSNEDVQTRIKQLQTGCPGKLVLLGSCAGTQDAERMLHATFAPANVGGEWFRPVPTLIQLILSKTAYSLAALAMSNAVEAIHQQQQEQQRIETEREVEEAKLNILIVKLKELHELGVKGRIEHCNHSSYMVLEKIGEGGIQSSSGSPMGDPRVRSIWKEIKNDVFQELKQRRYPTTDTFKLLLLLTDSEDPL